MIGDRSWIVCWLHESRERDYVVFGSAEEARKVYQELLDRADVHSASICGVIESTDYGPHPALGGAYEQDIARLYELCEDRRQRNQHLKRLLKEALNKEAPHE